MIYFKLFLSNLYKLISEGYECYRERREGVTPLTILDRLRALED